MLLGSAKSSLLYYRLGLAWELLPGSRTSDGFRSVALVLGVMLVRSRRAPTVVKMWPKMCEQLGMKFPNKTRLGNKISQ